PAQRRLPAGAWRHRRAGAADVAHAALPGGAGAARAGGAGDGGAGVRVRRPSTVDGLPPGDDAAGSAHRAAVRAGVVVSPTGTADRRRRHARARLHLQAVSRPDDAVPPLVAALESVRVRVRGLAGDRDRDDLALWDSLLAGIFRQAGLDRRLLDG